MFGAGVEDTLVNSEHGAAYSSASLEVMCGAMTHSSHRIETSYAQPVAGSEP